MFTSNIIQAFSEPINIYIFLHGTTFQLFCFDSEQNLGLDIYIGLKIAENNNKNNQQMNLMLIST